MAKTHAASASPAPVVATTGNETTGSVAQVPSRDMLRALHTVRFKGARGVQEVLIAARPEKAGEVAKVWVQSQPGRILLQVFSAVVADESILATVKPAEPSENSLEG